MDDKPNPEVKKDETKAPEISLDNTQFYLLQGKEGNTIVTYHALFALQDISNTTNAIKHYNNHTHLTINFPKDAADLLTNTIKICEALKDNKSHITHLTLISSTYLPDDVVSEIASTINTTSRIKSLTLNGHLIKDENTAQFLNTINRPNGFEFNTEQKNVYTVKNSQEVRNEYLKQILIFLGISVAAGVAVGAAATLLSGSAFIGVAIGATTSAYCSKKLVFKNPEFKEYFRVQMTSLGLA